MTDHNIPMLHIEEVLEKTGLKLEDISPDTIIPYNETHNYLIPVYSVGDNGLELIGFTGILYLRGSKITEENVVEKQNGVLTESLIQVAIEHLKLVNVGELSSRETALAITKLQEAQFWLGERARDRKRRNVQGTYKK